MPHIRLLDPSVSSLIAAGEVIERPASALKELLENALDAGARRISVEIAGAGKSLIRISDDGGGMDREDCALCLERHATSKIAGLSDLDAIATFGFRGEALFAIAAVSRLTLTSARRGAKGGWRVEAEAGRIKRQGPAACAGGTTVEVRDLFFNTPARLKFLRSDAFESGRLAAAVEDAALADPGIAFSFKTDGRKSLSFAPVKAKDPLEAYGERVQAVLGRDTGAGLASSSCDRPGLKAWIFVSPVERLAPTRSLQHWIVNRRPVTSKALQAALYRAFRDCRPGDRHPVCVAHIQVPPEQIDVNVHPGKREVRFKREGEVHELVAELVGRAIAQRRSPLAGETDGGPSFVGSPQRGFGGPGPRHAGARGAEPVQELLDVGLPVQERLAAKPGDPAWWRPPYRYLGQIGGCFLAFEASGGLFVLDQHAAQERILYEKYAAALRTKGGAAQPLMLPVQVDLGASRRAEVLEQRKRLADLGFAVEAFGRTAVEVTAAPAVFGRDADLKDVVLRLLDYLEDPAHAALDAGRAAAATVACKRAVKAHDPLGPEEAMRLLTDLKACADGTSCPHGRPSMMGFSGAELARRFDRS